MIKDKLYTDWSKAHEKVKQWRDEGDTIVFTNGCFDLLHIGHVLYLEEAKTLGNRLIIAVNSDESTRRLKGPNRPIKDEYNRTHILAALESTDMVLTFDQDTPFEIIQLLLPDVLVKGGDWKSDQIVGSDIVIKNGGTVRSLKFVDGYSTTALEQKIRQGR